MVASACAASAAVRTASAEKPPCARPFFSKATSSTLSSTRRTLIGAVLLSAWLPRSNPKAHSVRLVSGGRNVTAIRSSTACLLTTPAGGYIWRGDALRRTSGPRQPPSAPAPPSAAADRRARAHDPGVPARGARLHRDVARLPAETMRRHALGRHRLRPHRLWRLESVAGRSRPALHGDRGRRGAAAPAAKARNRGLRAGRAQRRRHHRA